MEDNQTGKTESIKHIAHDALHDLIHFDSKLFRTLPVLLFRPGLLPQKSLQGEQRYVRPLTLFVFLNFIFFTFKSRALFRYNLNTYLGNRALADHLNSILAQLHLPLNVLTERFNTAMRFEQKEYMVIMVPFFALFMWFFYLYKKIKYVEHLVFSLYFYAYFIVFLMITPLLLSSADWLFQRFRAGNNLIYADQPAIVTIIAVNFVYLVFALRKFYKEGWLITLLKSAALSFLVMALVIYLYKDALFYIVLHSISE